MSYQKIPPGADWQMINVTYVAGVGTEIVPSPGTVLWTPPFPCLVRGLVANDDSGNALVGAGGATTLSIGVDTQPVVFVSAIALASYATILQGWGVSGTSTSSASSGCQDSGVVLAPAGSLPGRATLARSLRGFGNAGTITGTLRIHFEMRPFAGAFA